jgi:exopolysaccharide biosynthesis polyprenyl glycosylphosphotransferase
MLKEQAKLFTEIAVIADTVVIATAFFAAYQIRSTFGGLDHIGFYTWILFVVLPIWYFLFYHFKLYASLRLRSIPSIIISIIKVHAVGGIVTSSIIYLVEPRGFSRGFFISFIIISSVFVLLEKILLKAFLSYIRRKGYNCRYILIVGCNERAQSLSKIIVKHAKWGLRIVGFLKLSDEDACLSLHGYEILGRLDELVEICKKRTIDEVVFCVPMEALPNVEDYVRDMEEMGVTTRMALDFYELHRSKCELTLFHEQVPMLTFHSRAFDADHLFIKRCLDILGAITGLCMTGLLFPFIALSIKVNSSGPLLFGQKRVRERGRIFTCWKFRSMYVDAEERKKELMHLNEMNGAIFKIKNDPRITKVGNFLRKTSLDELPQFWNVLRGEMSLVGTRPPTPGEVAEYENWHRKRICIKPGITGLWQVSGRNQIQDFDQVARLDIEYIETWSLWLDIKILLKTIWIVFARSGSC